MNVICMSTPIQRLHFILGNILLLHFIVIQIYWESMIFLYKFLENDARIKAQEEADKRRSMGRD